MFLRNAIMSGWPTLASIPATTSLNGFEVVKLKRCTLTCLVWCVMTTAFPTPSPQQYSQTLIYRARKAASSMSAATSFGLDTSTQWLAPATSTVWLFGRPAYHRSSSGLIVLSAPATEHPARLVSPRRRLLLRADVVAVLGKNVVNAPPPRTVGPRAVDQNDIANTTLLFLRGERAARQQECRDKDRQGHSSQGPHERS